MLHCTLRQLVTSAFLLLFVLSGTTLAAQKLEGMASFYGDKFDGKPTSTGEIFRKKGYSAASLDLPWGTVVEVTNLSNGKTVQVRVNDCGPHAKGRIIDLTRQAAEELDFVKQGEAKVRLRILQTSTSGPTCYRGKWAKKLKAQGKKIPPPPAPWDPTVTAKIEPINPVVPGPQAADPAIPVPTGRTRGKASYYADKYNGEPTSTGEIYQSNLLTAASKAFPYGTVLEVTNVANGAKVTVRVNDCGPHHPERILDLSRAAAAQIGLIRAGVAMVEMKVLKMGELGPTCDRSAADNNQTTAGGQSPRPVTRGPLPITRPKLPVVDNRTPTPVDQQPENLVTVYENQVGAFGSQANAETLARKLLADDFSRPYAIQLDGVFKVFTGMSMTKEEAKVIQQKLQDKGYPKSKLVAVKMPTKDLVDMGVVPASVDPQPIVEPASPSTYSNVATPLSVPAPEAETPAPTRPEFAPDDILFGVQVAAFGSQANADKEVARLRAAAGNEEVYSANVGKTFRVFAGKFYFQSQAEVLKKKLRAVGYDQATVRRVQ